MAEKMRVHILAKEMNVKSKAILLKCAAEDIPVKNHMSTLSAGLEATIREWFSEGDHATTLETSDRIDLEKVRVKRRRKPRKETETVAADGTPTDAGDATAATAVLEPPPSPAKQEAGDAPTGDTLADPSSAAAAELLPAVAEPTGSERDLVAEPQTDLTSADTLEAAPADEASKAPLEVSTTADLAASAGTDASAAEAGQASDDAATAGPAGADPTTSAGSTIAEPPVSPTEPTPSVVTGPVGPQNIPTPARVRGPRVVRYEAPDQDVIRPRPFGPRSRPVPGAPPPMGPVPRLEPGGPEQRRSPGPGVRGRPGRTHPRRGRGGEAGDRPLERNARDLAERRERLAGATGRRIHVRRAVDPGKGVVGPAVRKTHAEVQAPVTIKKFCAATGIGFTQVFGLLQREHSVVVGLNSMLDEDLAQLVALELGIELTVIEEKTLLDELKEEFATRERKHLQPRPPVVTFLGHVDHGKTSLLDYIRRARVASSEAGGITQHVGSYHFRRDKIAVTFLDTPGHKAFTAMRARGAQMTDIVVLVVAADDGIMPQTIEAINHAKAAEVPVVVALNKIDLPGINVTRTYTQLAEHGLTPSGDWGGETDVIHTSATTGQGIDELLEHLMVLAELRELKADPKVDPAGVVIEAETKTGAGPVVRVLVQEGELRTGSIVVCGPAFGKVRALLDDQGNRIKSAGPSMPVEIWGLDCLPLAGDHLYGVKSMQRAKTVAEQTRAQRAAGQRASSQRVRSLEDVFGKRSDEAKAELNLIIKSDVDGSLQAVRQVLDELPTDQVRVTIRHTGVGAVTDSDVHLADACDGIVVAFNVIPSPGAKKLAAEAKVEIRPYRVIYEIVDDIRKAMEGLLEPEQRREDRATAQVREVFHLSKLGMVAGCYITSGTVVRNHRARLIRDGVVVRDDCTLGSLRRFKDDVKEVREGMECGIRLEGFDDVKKDDVIETYEVIEVARTL